jgi:hypothetical protein
MKMGPDALGTTENESGSAKHENGNRRPRYRRNRVQARKTGKGEPTHSALQKMSPGAQNMKTGTDALSTVENKFGRAKHKSGTRRTRQRRQRVWERKIRKRDPTPSIPSKMSPRAQNMKKGHDALRTAENESGRAKHDNKSDALGTAENESGSAKHENGNCRPRYRRKRVPVRKT